MMSEQVRAAVSTLDREERAASVERAVIWQPGESANRRGDAIIGQRIREGYHGMVAVADRAVPWDIQAIPGSGFAASTWQLAAKRLFDVAASLVLLVILSPCLALIAAAVRLTSPGPVIFRQTRIGLHHRPFTIYKFRTMYSDSRGGELGFTRGAIHKRRGDPRVTPVGRILRRTSLDELPQLLNVLKGEMSLVGPRPELPEIVRHYEPWQYARLTVLPGITGWWQVRGRGERPLHLHIEDDLYYIRHFSLWLDAKILALTVVAVITGSGAF